jgi:hypothetical protein
MIRKRLVCVVFLVAAAGLLDGVRDASAVILYLKNQEQPIRGFFVRENEHVVVVQELLGDGTTAERSVSRSEIEDMIRTVSPERLETLRPAAPDAYREYAEELSEKRKDPDAQVTALRLYQIAAFLDPSRLGRSCLLGMVPLARDAAEQRRFRAMAYLLDPAHDPVVLQPPDPAPQRSPELDAKQAEFLLKALRALRQGRQSAALRQARRCKLEERLPLLTDTISYQEFEDACDAQCPDCDRGWQLCPSCGGEKYVRPGGGTGRVLCPRCGGRGDVRCPACGGQYKPRPLAPSLLKRILQLELAWLPGAETAPHAPPTARPPWSLTVQRGDTAPAPELSLETLTEFNPRQNRYRDGQWLE